jgi:hypothetical protein
LRWSTTEFTCSIGQHQCGHGFAHAQNHTNSLPIICGTHHEFSIVQRKVVSPNDFTDLDTVIDRLSAFEARYNQTAPPFKWKFTTTDLANLLDRLDQHQPSQAANPAQPRAA